MKIRPKDIGNFKSQEQAEAYKNAMKFKKEMDQRAAVTMGYDEFVGDNSGGTGGLTDQIPGKGKVMINYNPKNQARDSFVDYNPENGQVKNFGEKIVHESNSGFSLCKAEEAELSIKEKSSWLWHDKTIYQLHEFGPTGTEPGANGRYFNGIYDIEKTLKIDKKNGNMDYKESVTGSYHKGTWLNSFGNPMGEAWGPMHMSQDRPSLLERT
jgi:hypothetical protein